MKKKPEPKIDSLNETTLKLFQSGWAFVFRPHLEVNAPTGIVWVIYAQRGEERQAAAGFTVREAIEKAVKGQWTPPTGTMAVQTASVDVDFDSEEMPDEPAARLVWIQGRYERGKLTEEQVRELLEAPVDESGKVLAEVAP